MSESFALAALRELETPRCMGCMLTRYVAARASVAWGLKKAREGRQAQGEEPKPQPLQSNQQPSMSRATTREVSWPALTANEQGVDAHASFPLAPGSCSLAVANSQTHPLLGAA